MRPVLTIHDLLGAGAATDAAIRAPGRSTLTYAGLRSLADRTVAALNRIGIGRNDRVAIVLPNGPEMAAAFVAIACGATTAPLNPAYRDEEFAFYLDDLKAKALVVLKGTDTPARAVAERLGIPVLDLVPGEAAGDTAHCALGPVPLAEPAGGPVDLLIRPEDLRLDGEGAPALVVWREFYGHDQRAGLRLADGTVLVARLDARQSVTPGLPARVSLRAPARAFPAG